MRKLGLLASMTALLAAPAVRAQEPAPEAAAPPPVEAAPPAAPPAAPVAVATTANGMSWAARSLTVGRGHLQIDGDVLINMTKSLVAKPFSIAPNIYYGVTDDLQIGLIHHDPLFPGLPGVDIGPAAAALDVPGAPAGYFALEYGTPMPLFG